MGLARGLPPDRARRLAAALCAALAAAIGSCGGDDESRGRPHADPTVATGTFAWTPQGEEEPLPYVEETHEDAGSWMLAWNRRRDARSPAPDVDFAKDRVVVVAQLAKNGGYGGARFLSLERGAGRAVVAYEAIEPAPGSVHRLVYRGYLGFYAVVPRDAGALSFRRTPRR